LRCFLGEPPVAQKLELAPGSAFRIELLYACQVGVKNRQRRIEYLVIQGLHPVNRSQLRGNLLKVFQLRSMALDVSVERLVLVRELANCPAPVLL
jgi:hypothetical protein